MISLGFGKYAKAERIYLLERITGDSRGRGRRTEVWVDGIAEPIVAARTERAILADMERQTVPAPSLSGVVTDRHELNATPASSEERERELARGEATLGEERERLERRDQRLTEIEETLRERAATLDERETKFETSDVSSSDASFMAELEIREERLDEQEQALTESQERLERREREVAEYVALAQAKLARALPRRRPSEEPTHPAPEEQKPSAPWQAALSVLRKRRREPVEEGPSEAS